MKTTLLLASVVSAAVRVKGSQQPLTCQPLAQHPGVPIFHIIGNITRDPASGNLTYEHINDANGLFKWRGVYHIFHQCCQNHWDHVVSTDLVHWKRLPPPVQPNRTDPAEWYDSKGSFDGSASILPDHGPVILYDTIGPFSPPLATSVAAATAAAVATGARGGASADADASPAAPMTPPLRDNPGCQGLSWPVDPHGDPELTYWRKDVRNPIDFGADFRCGQFAKNTVGAFPGGIWRSNVSSASGDIKHVYSYLSFGYRFESSDPSLHEWRKVEPQFLSNASRMERGGQWFMRVPATVDGLAAPPGAPTHLVSCGGGSQFCLGYYDEQRQTWSDYIPPAPAVPTPGPKPMPMPNISLCTTFGRDWDVPGGDYNRGDNATRADFRNCDGDGHCPCQADCLHDPNCDAWTIVPGDRCCLKHFGPGWRPNPVARLGTGFITGMKDPTRCVQKPPVPPPGPAPSVAHVSTDLGPDANWLTAGFLSGGLGLSGTGTSDRMLNIGWITPMNFDPPRKSSGGLTIPREINLETRTTQPVLVANPVRELVALRNSSLASESAVRLDSGVLHAAGGTGGGAAASSDTEVRFTLPPAEPGQFQVFVLASGTGTKPMIPSNVEEGVVVTIDVAAPTADGSRFGTAAVGDASASRPGRSGAFTVLPGESELHVRVLTDRVVAEAFVQGGRAVFTRSFVPSSAAHSTVYVAANTTTDAAVDVWSMGCGWVGVDDATDKSSTAEANVLPVHKAPGGAYNLTNWSLDTCLAHPRSVSGAALARYSSPNFFLTATGNIAMITPDNATAVTAHADHPRTEFRDVSVPDWPIGGDAARSHALLLRTAVQRVSNTSGETILAQIHGSVDQEIAKVLKLRWTHGLVEARVKNRTAPHAEFGLSLGQYALGETLTVSVNVWANATLTISVNGRSAEYAPPINSADRFYFKAGDYNQCHPCGTAGQYAEVHVSGLTALHEND